MLSSDHPSGIPNLENIRLGQHNTVFTEKRSLQAIPLSEAEELSHGFRTWVADEQQYLVLPLQQ
jgi:hypothetical protein